MIKTIPLEKIDAGIKRCIANSQELLDLANKINEGDKINDGFISIPFSLELPVVLHYYALEELGKAIKLEQEKNNVQSQESKIKINWFIDHDAKVKATIEEIGDEFHVLKPEPIPDSKPGEFTHHTVKYSGPAVNNFKYRSSRLLTDYDENTKNGEPFLNLVYEKNFRKKFQN